MIADGVVLLIVVIAVVVRAHERKNERGPKLGVVPLDTSRIAGPATLTTILVLVGSYMFVSVILSLINPILHSSPLTGILKKVLHA